MTHSLNLASLSNVICHIKAPQHAIENDVKLNNEQTDDFPPWHESIIAEVAQFSEFLLSKKACKEQPELVALAFWCRKSNLLSISSDFKKLTSSAAREPIGKVFHIAPANVDTVFFYSLLLSMLSGNQNIVRISERSGKICRLLIQLLQQFLQTKHPKLMPALVSIVEYSAIDTSTTATFSQWCDLRVIWGGDSAIKAISIIEPTTKQLSFPDRFSIAVCQLNEEDNIRKVASAFIADFLPFNQQACSSPKALFWLNTSNSLQRDFYHELCTLIKSSEGFNISHQVERQINLQELLLLSDNQVMANQSSSQLAHIRLNSITPKHLINHQGNGLLLVQDIDDIAQLPLHEKLQTISYSGIDSNLFKSINNKHYKRYTHLGTALAFNHIWDGVNLLKELTTNT